MRGQKVLARLVDGRPLNATLEAFNAYELLFDLGSGKKTMVFKHAVSYIEFTKKPEEEEA
jgi:sRNA-binding regulator protein Hfq